MRIRVFTNIIDQRKNNQHKRAKIGQAGLHPPQKLPSLKMATLSKFSSYRFKENGSQRMRSKWQIREKGGPGLL
jgi:hypothetical protein